MSDVWSDELQTYVPEEKKDQLEAYHQRITQPNANEIAMQKGVQNAANQPANMWNRLKGLMGSGS